MKLRKCAEVGRGNDLVSLGHFVLTPLVMGLGAGESLARVVSQTVLYLLVI